MSARAPIVFALSAVALGGCWSKPAAPPAAALSVASLLGPTEAAGFERAVGRRDFSFPADHGPHDGFRTEWWYYTGNLSASDGRRFGYQLTFFKTALAATPAERSSAWGTGEVFMGHFAVTDVGARRFLSHERFARRAVGLAGARSEPFRVWLEDWSAEAEGDGMRLRAAAGELALDLLLEPGKPPVLQGDAGLSRKGAGEGNASYYYSQTRMPSRGRLTVGGESRQVEGTSWMDREWSTSVLERGQVGWDWFALQLDDGRDLMVYLIRREDGSADRHSAGVLVDPSGASLPLTPGDWRLEALDHWTNPDGARYPARWRLALPSERLELTIEPLLADQEHRHTFRYWEGAVAASGSSDGTPVSGRGYAELTGY